MMVHPFSLQPFPDPATPAPGLSLTGTVARAGDRLSIHYSLAGPDQSRVLLAAAEPPVRKHHLWETTCFEFFLGPSQTDRYWEFNLSPAGHWNVYRFEQYRQGMQEETAFEALPFEVSIAPDRMSLAITLNLAPLVSATTPLDVAITAVIESDNSISYWALAHVAPEADFHQRNSFMVHL